MAYIGRGTDKLSDIEKLDTITFDGSSSYTLQKNSVNFTPSSANNLQVSIDGVVQAGNFTVSGSTIDFGTAVPGTSTNDFIFHYGTGLITTPADGTVTTAKLADSSVTSAKLSGVTQGITMADQWRLTATTNYNTNADVTSNWERNDSVGYASLGTGLTESSGIFSFPQTGLYFINFQARVNMGGSESHADFNLHVTTDNSSYTRVTETTTGNGSTTTNVAGTLSNTYLINVTDTSNVKFKFKTESFTSTSSVTGTTTRQETGFTVLRIGDSQ